MADSTPWHVYNNLIEMFKYRNCNLTSKRLDVDTFAERLNYHEYIIIEAQRNGSVEGAPVSPDYVDTREKNIIVVLVAPNSTIATKTPEFKKLLTKVPLNKNESNNIIIVSQYTLTNPIIKSIPAQGLELRAHIEHYNYNMFIIVKPTHSSVPPHVMLSDAEVDALCDTYRLNRKEFQRITRGDVMSVWLGLRPGAVVKVYRQSETSGEIIAYRLCE
jgi:DNA-directed RNA polymerase subunit H (RpoH/RPB5)